MQRIVYPYNEGSIPFYGAIFRIVTANSKAKLFGCLATKAILLYKQEFLQEESTATLAWPGGMSVTKQLGKSPYG